MTGDSQLATVLGGATTTSAGIAILPNTNGNSFAHIMAFVLIAMGTMILVSFIAVKIAKHTIKK